MRGMHRSEFNKNLKPLPYAVAAPRQRAALLKAPSFASSVFASVPARMNAACSLPFLRLLRLFAATFFDLQSSFLDVGSWSFSGCWILDGWSFLGSWPLLAIFTFFQKGCQNVPKEAKTCQKRPCRPFFPVAQTCWSAGFWDNPLRKRCCQNLKTVKNGKPQTQSYEPMQA